MKGGRAQVRAFHPNTLGSNLGVSKLVNQKISKLAAGVHLGGYTIVIAFYESDEAVSAIKY